MAPSPLDAVRALTSRAARRTVVYAVLLAGAAALLYGVAVVGYVGFYREYVPHEVRTVAVHLQYGAKAAAAAPPPALVDSLLHHHHHSQRPHPPPYGLADLRGLGLKTDQAYDVSVVLTVPQSPANLGLGNVMVQVAMAAGGDRRGGGGGGGGGGETASPLGITEAARLPPPPPQARAFLSADGRRVVFAAARPARLPYRDPMVALATRLALLPLHVLAPATATAAARTRLAVPVAEGLAFESGGGGSGGGLPAVLFLEVSTHGGSTASIAAASGTPPSAGGPGVVDLETYAAEVVFAARLRGLRWLMYHHGVVSFVLLTTAWWLVEVVCMVGVFFVLGAVLGSGGGDRPGGHVPDGSSSSSSSRDGSARGKGRAPLRTPDPGRQQRIKTEPASDGAGDDGTSLSSATETQTVEIKKEEPEDEEEKEEEEEEEGASSSSGGGLRRLASIPAAPEAGPPTSRLTPPAEKEELAEKESTEEEEEEEAEAEAKEEESEGDSEPRLPEPREGVHIG